MGIIKLSFAGINSAMRIRIPLIFLLAMALQMEACIIPPCPGDDSPFPNFKVNRPTTKNPRGSGINGHDNKCNSDDDCRHPMMELEVPYCKNGVCKNYQWNPKPSGWHH
ncbi:hypothetical protein B9Z55_014081 [Caenorhabditis nigoni]|uniref:Uncharacterized protein n=1 Tax=Caenorhabditis nigoni TaxID=1611254 RepID=A0A2G5U504_9PELO|nr:hypothetical protein B9Z55_014081 [Caenorhabditis nigoni]